MSGFRPPRALPALAALLSGWAFLAGPARAETIRVTIEGLAFAPAHVDAKVGDRIEWVNNEVLVHTSTASGLFDVTIPAKKKASAVLRSSGTVDYICRYHPNMKGSITVAP